MIFIYDITVSLKPIICARHCRLRTYVRHSLRKSRPVSDGSNAVCRCTRSIESFLIWMESCTSFSASAEGFQYTSSLAKPSVLHNEQYIFAGFRSPSARPSVSMILMRI